MLQSPNKTPQGSPKHSDKESEILLFEVPEILVVEGSESPLLEEPKIPLLIRKFTDLSLMKNPEEYSLSQVMLLQLLAIELMDPTPSEDAESTDLFFWHMTKIFHNNCHDLLSNIPPLAFDRTSDQFIRLKNKFSAVIKDIQEIEGIIYNVDSAWARLVVRSFANGKLFDPYDLQWIVTSSIFIKELIETLKEYNNKITKKNIKTFIPYFQELAALKERETPHLLGIDFHRLQLSLETFIGQLIHSNRIDTAQAIHNFFHIVKKVFDAASTAKKVVDQRVEVILAKALLRGLHLEGKVIELSENKNKKEDNSFGKTDPHLSLMIRIIRAAVQMKIFTFSFDRKFAHEIYLQVQRQPVKWIKKTQSLKRKEKMQKEENEVPQNIEIDIHQKPYERAHQLRHNALLKMKMKAITEPQEKIVLNDPPELTKKLQRVLEKLKFMQIRDVDDRLSASARTLFFSDSPSRARAQSGNNLRTQSENNLRIGTYKGEISSKPKPQPKLKDKSTKEKSRSQIQSKPPPKNI